MFFLIAIISFIFIFGILVFIHELGHYITARKLGFIVEEFAIGMGPKLFTWKRKPKNSYYEIQYTIRALPIGGFVKIYGQGDFENFESKAFQSKKPSKRIIVLAAGVIMNFIFAAFLLYIQGANHDYKYRNLNNSSPVFGEKSDALIVIRDISQESPLNGRISALDIVSKVNGESYDANKFTELISDNKGKEIELEILPYTSSEKRTIKVTPRTEFKAEEGSLGIKTSQISLIEFNGFAKIFAGFGQSINIVKTFGLNLAGLISSSFNQKSALPLANNLSGPIGIFEALKIMLEKFGVWGLLELTILFSLNLALINSLPIPSLDGGHILFTLIEVFNKNRRYINFYTKVTVIGFVLLMSCMAVTASMDFIKFTPVRDLFCNQSSEGICKIEDLRN